jgi:hypothetical protein
MACDGLLGATAVSSAGDRSAAPRSEICIAIKVNEFKQEIGLGANFMITALSTMASFQQKRFSAVQ